jgi:hypothetical protein
MPTKKNLKKVNLLESFKQGGTVGRHQDVKTLGEPQPMNTDAQNFPKREIPEDININPDLLYFNPGQAFFENNPEEGLDRQRDWLTNYIQSPMYLERLSKEFPNYSQSELEAERDTRLNNVITTKATYPDEPLGNTDFGYISGLYNIKGTPEDIMVRTSEGMVPQTGSGSSRGLIELEPEYRPEGMSKIEGAYQYPYPGYELVPLHELGHAVDDGGVRIPATTRNLIYENVESPTGDIFSSTYMSYPEDNQEFTYVGSPSEFVNRLLPFRYELQRLNIVDPNTQQITESDIKNYLESTNFERSSFKNSQVEDLFKNVKGEGNTEQERLDDQIKRITFMLNNIAMNESQEMFYGKQGGTVRRHQSYLPPPSVRQSPNIYETGKEVVQQVKDVQKTSYAKQIGEILRDDPTLTLGEAIDKTGKDAVTDLMGISQYVPGFLKDKLPEDAREFSRLRNNTALELLEDEWFMNKYGNEIFRSAFPSSGAADVISEKGAELFEQGAEAFGDAVKGFTNFLTPKPPVDTVGTKQEGGTEGKDPNKEGGEKEKDPNREFDNTVSPSGKTGYAEIREENLAIPNPNEGKFIYQYATGGVHRAQDAEENVDPMKYKPVVGNRIGTRQNPDGSESTHLMAYSKVDDLGGYVAFPTLFQNEQGEFYEPENPIAEAVKKNEIYRFGNDLDSAKEFAAGSWKSNMQSGGLFQNPILSMLDMAKEVGDEMVQSELNDMFSASTEDILGFNFVPRDENGVVIKITFKGQEGGYSKNQESVFSKYLDMAKDKAVSAAGQGVGFLTSVMKEAIDRAKKANENKTESTPTEDPVKLTPAQANASSISSAIDKVAGDNQDLRALLYTTSYMENTFGANPNAYGRDYTHSFMSLDDPAINQIFDVREGATDYTKGQKAIFEMYENLGLPSDKESIVKLLDKDDPLASVATARAYYATVPTALPSAGDSEALFNYFSENYNKGGQSKYQTEDEALDRFNVGYSKLSSEYDFEMGGTVPSQILTSRAGVFDPSYKQGQPVFVPTTQGIITMDGVDTDLVGISDGGEIAYMPANSGKHRFQGKNILEVPADLFYGQDGGLADWFKEEWVRIDTEGNITGPCGTMKKGKSTTRCLPKKKAQSLTKAERKATARKKVRGSKKGKQFVANTKKAKVTKRDTKRG